MVLFYSLGSIQLYLIWSDRGKLRKILLRFPYHEHHGLELWPNSHVHMYKCRHLHHGSPKTIN